MILTEGKFVIDHNVVCNQDLGDTDSCQCFNDDGTCGAAGEHGGMCSQVVLTSSIKELPKAEQQTENKAQ